MNDSTYNGWANYPTWVTNLWLNNESGTYFQGVEMARDAIRHAPQCAQVVEDIWTVEQAQRFNLAADLNAWVERDILPDLNGSLAADLLGSALGEVNWDEIARAFLESVENES